MSPVIERSILQRPLLSAGNFSPIQAQVDDLVGHFVEEAANPQTLAALMAGGMAYRMGRLGMMGLGSPVGLRPLSVVVGLGSEVTAYEFTNRVLQTLRASLKPAPTNASPNLWSWAGPGGWRDGLISSAITFGFLKGAGHLAREENIVIQHAFQSTAMVAGHQAVGLTGIAPRPEGSLAEQLVHAEAVNLQLSAGMSLVHGMAPGMMALERRMDLSLRSEIPTTPLFQRGVVQNLIPGAGPRMVFAEGGAENPHIVLMSSDNRDKEIGRERGGPPAPQEELARSQDNSPADRLARGEEEGEGNQDAEWVHLFRNSLPEEVRRSVDHYISVLRDQVPELRDKPVVLMAQALAASLEEYNRSLESRLLLEDISTLHKVRRMRDWLRDSFGEHLRLPEFTALGIHYYRALAFTSLPSMEEEASENLSESLSNHVLISLRKMQDLGPDDPKLPILMGILGTRVGRYAKDSYLAILDFALKNCLVTRRHDPIDNQLINDFRRRFQRLHPQGFPEIEGHQLQAFYNLEIMIHNLREKWGSFHPFLKGYDHIFSALGQDSTSVTLRYQILKRVESQFWVDNAEEPTEEDLN